ncbi:epi-1 family protein [Megaselia abdita]
MGTLDPKNVAMTVCLAVICGLLYLDTVQAELTPPYFNLATGRKIYSTATCGVDTDGPELYCKLVGANTENDLEHSVIQGQICDWCDPSKEDKNHPPENAIDGTTAWWQSPPLSRGNKYNEVNLTIDFGQEFHVAYLFIRMGNSPRPGLWTLEKSSDYGKSWSPWQHFSDTESDCELYFGKDSIKPLTRDDDVICTTEFSKIVPLEDGEIPIMLLNNRPSAQNYFNSTALQEWTRATNIRIRLLRTKNLLGHLMSVARQDPTVTRRYFYSIKDISIGGRCMCNGHADTCDVLDPKSPVRILACRCQHQTCGIQCNECCPGFEQKKWRQNTNARPFKCEPCNCHGHSNTCIYDEETDNKSMSLDIHGNYEGGGVCQNCQHNTEGINCNKCKDTFYRPRGRKWDDFDVCRPCDCDSPNLTGNCEEETGRCECRKEFQPPNCDACAYGYYGYPQCRECDCNLDGTDGYHCEAVNGTCPCKFNFDGNHCKQCASGYFSFPECKACECDSTGSVNNDCDVENGQCKCLSNFGGDRCDRCKHGYYRHPECVYCDCDNQGTEDEICSKGTGKCICREGFGGKRCDQCLPGFYDYPNCKPCNCSSTGSTSITCDNTGKCNCLPNFAGKQCTSCSAGYYQYPECLPCNCDHYGAEGVSCNGEGQCTCQSNFDGKTCDVCHEGFYNFPACEECNCDPAGVIAKFSGCGNVPAGELCQCKDRVGGRICNQCKPLYWNLNISNPDGCEACDCFLDGTISNLDTCHSKSGQCICKPYVTDRQCRECMDGTYDLSGGSLFGCKDCNCDVGGSRSSICEKTTGQCNCYSRITGLTCDRPLTTHYFPTLHQFQFEYEDGSVPSGAQVRYQYEEHSFPEFSGKGYAVFSGIQSEVINEVMVFQSSVYRMVIRYINPTEENAIAEIFIFPENPIELEQKTNVLLKPTNVPKFITVSGAKGEKPSPIVLDPGRYTITTKTNKNVMLDYFVLLPAAYYEASILTRKVETPCSLGLMDLCRRYKYPSVNAFQPSSIPFISEGSELGEVTEFYADPEHLETVIHSGQIPIISNTQKHLKYPLDVPRSGKYIVVIDYITVRDYDSLYVLNVRIDDKDSMEYGTATMYPCLFSMSCRQPIVDKDSKEMEFEFDVSDLKPLEIYHDFDDYGKIAVISVTAIPANQWSTDYVNPSTVCVMSNGQCSTPKFRSVPNSKKIEYETDHEDRIATNKPPYASMDEKVKLIYLDESDSSILIDSKVLDPGRYVFIVKYYQPDHPKYKVTYSLEAGKQYYDGKFDVNHCPSSSGCRGRIKPDGANWWFDIDDEFKFTMTNNRPQGFWVDYLLIVPVAEYNDDLLEEETFDQTKEFIKECGQDHFYIPLNASDFCKKSVFSLTSQYNHGALQCNCNYEGSNSFECDPYGGQCQCKANIIGRQCDACKTGFYGFPDCKPCNCPSTALCEKNTGECICPRHVTGEKCDKCEPYTYGFHQIIGCEECNCNRMGVENGAMQCDLNNGNCDCRQNIEGRACDQCSNGYYDFPNCQRCLCNHAGSTYEVCDKSDGGCFCKKNVIGPECDTCKEGTYNLQESNPDGCNTCFCFGKTSRCESAYLRVFNVSLVHKHSVNVVEFHNNVIDIQDWPREDILLNETKLEADFSLIENPNSFVYFGVLSFLGDQNNHLTAYGGFLGYNLEYTTTSFGQDLTAPDVLLVGSKKVLTHQSYSQPASGQTFTATIEMIESNFQTLDGKEVSRADFMMVLRDLNAIYIRGNYYQNTVVSYLSDPYLTLAGDDPEYGRYQELPVEKCQCPPGYAGLSCEDCAPGYYRDPDGPMGGYCIPCQCNGHSDTCDCDTGICKDCQHSTFGEHCEMCVEGYYGNATYGTPYDCMICACPLPFASNNFATGCEISEQQNAIRCDCKPGYTGARCESCAPGFFGRPEVPGEVCRPCDCSGNINPENPGSCDTITGECLQCLNNTYGKACNLCAPGYFGDAVVLKDCQSCDCDEVGTLSCDSSTGTCVCHDNVIGERCDECKPDHYGFESGYGCRDCDCGVASNSTQCDLHTGECACKPGVTGRQCDRCGVDFWNYNADGCTPCLCNKGYSRGFGCNPNNGQCECLPGVVGEKCDACPHRWVLVKDEGCSECNVCHHALLDVTDNLRREIDPVVDEFKSTAMAFYTSQKLNFIEESADKLTPEVNALDPQGVNLNPGKEAVNKLESETKKILKSTQYNEENASDNRKKSNYLLDNTTVVLELSHKTTQNVDEAIKSVENLEKSFEKAHGSKIEGVLAEGNRHLDEMMKYVIDTSDSTAAVNKANEAYDRILELVEPLNQQKKHLDELTNDIGDFSDKLEDIHNNTEKVFKNLFDVQQLNAKNKLEYDNSKFDTVSDQAKEVESHIKNASDYKTNGDLTLSAINLNFGNVADILDTLKDINKDMDEALPAAEESFTEARDLVLKSDSNVEDLVNHANQIEDDYRRGTYDNEDHIKAASAYSNIVKAVGLAHDAAKEAMEAARNTTELLPDIGINPAAEASAISEELLQKAKDSLFEVHENLEPHVNKSVKQLDFIKNLNADTEKKLEDINLAIAIDPSKLAEQEVWEEADKKAGDALDSLNAALDILKPLSNSTDEDLRRAKQISKDVDSARKGILQVSDQVKDLETHTAPEVISLIDEVKFRQDAVQKDLDDMKQMLADLKNSVENARQMANAIEVGVKLNQSSIVELKTPEDMSSTTSKKVSLYFKRTGDNPNGLLMYLGNLDDGQEQNEKSQDQPQESNDFMALHLTQGYPRLTIDVGNGPEEVSVDKYIEKDRWYQAVIDRTGSVVKLTIREEDEDKQIQEHASQPKHLSGANSNFDVDKNSRLIIGGIKQEDIPTDSQIEPSSFEGEIESLKINDESIGLWNLIDQKNVEGARERDSLKSIEKPLTGYRFNGNGYISIDNKEHSLRHQSAIQFRFKAPPESQNGLLFFAGNRAQKKSYFIDIELVGGAIKFQYKIGEHLVDITTGSSFNDNQWHKVVASRDGKRGLLTVDGQIIYQKEALGSEDNLQRLGHLFFGGHPNITHLHHPEVINENFEGCIDDVKINQVSVDLRRNLEAIGAKPGCLEKFSNNLAFKPHEFGFLQKAEVNSDNNFHISLRFRSIQSDGVIFYSANYNQMATIGLALLDGSLVLRSMGEELTTGFKKYNDGNWHVVTVSHNKDRLRLTVDDKYELK